MSRKQLVVAVVAALILAIPMVTFLSAFVVFPLVFYAIIAIFAILGWIPLMLAKPLATVGLRWDYQTYAAKCQMCFIIWVGCAYGLSHWGSVGGSMGARNESYLEVFFTPVTFPLHMLSRQNALPPRREAGKT